MPSREANRCCYQESVLCNVCLLRELKLRSWMVPSITGDLFELQKLSGDGLELRAGNSVGSDKFLLRVLTGVVKRDWSSV